MGKIVILSNHHSYTYNLRKELIQALLDQNNKVYIVQPYGEKVKLLEEMGCICIDVPFNGRGTNPVTDAKLIFQYYKILTKINPDAVLSYTIKPNLYGGIITKIKKIPFFPNVTGLGTAVENESFLKHLLILLYKFAFSNTSTVFFQNEKNKKYFLENVTYVKNSRVLPGSGVNLSQFKSLPYPVKQQVDISFVSRIMKDKGIDEYLEAAKYFSQNNENVNFHIFGSLDNEYKNIISDLHKNGTINYHGSTDNIIKVYEESHCIILPSYHEGMSNVLLEAAASARPILASNVPGCREIIDEGINGFKFEVKNSKDLIKTIKKFLNLSNNQKAIMGEAGRKKMESEFDRTIVVDMYIKEIIKTLEEK